MSRLVASIASHAGAAPGSPARIGGGSLRARRDRRLRGRPAPRRPAPRPVVLGSTATVPDTSCPELPCQAVGSVTASRSAPIRPTCRSWLPREGTIKAWTLTLAQPTPKQRSFFNGFSAPRPRRAGDSAPRAGKPTRRATRSSPRARSRSSPPILGQTVKFGSNVRSKRATSSASSVRPGRRCFSQGLDSKNVWRASRAPGTCTNSTSIREGEALEKVNRRATFGCKYTTARLLYTATLVEGK